MDAMVIKMPNLAKQDTRVLFRAQIDNSDV